MDATEAPSIAVFESASARLCRIVPTLQDAAALAADGRRDDVQSTRSGVVYSGPSLEYLAATSHMLARPPGSKQVALLAVPVPAVLENRPHVVLGTRVHIAYKVRRVAACFCARGCASWAARGCESTRSDWSAELASVFS